MDPMRRERKSFCTLEFETKVAEIAIISPNRDMVDLISAGSIWPHLKEV